MNDVQSQRARGRVLQYAFQSGRTSQKVHVHVSVSVDADVHVDTVVRMSISFSCFSLGVYSDGRCTEGRTG